MKIVSLIPARGGSKEIPDKNIVNLNGKPLIYYTIQASKNSSIDETWVSTNSSKISVISEGYGANIIKRPHDISKDDSKSEEALIHFAERVDFDIIVFIQATSPLLTSKYINLGLDMMKKYDSASESHYIYKKNFFSSQVPPGLPGVEPDQPQVQGRRSDHGSRRRGGGDAAVLRRRIPGE